MIWPVVIAIVVLALGSVVTVNETKVAPPPPIEVAADAQMAWLVRYCDAVQLYVEEHGGSGQINASALNLGGMALGNSQYVFKNFASGAPSNMLQCWVSPAMPGLTAGEIAEGAHGSAIVGTAISTSTWEGAVDGVQAPLVHPLSASEVGTAVVETGY